MQTPHQAKQMDGAAALSREIGDPPTLAQRGRVPCGDATCDDVLRDAGRSEDESDRSKAKESRELLNTRADERRAVAGGWQQAWRGRWAKLRQQRALIPASDGGARSGNTPHTAPPALIIRPGHTARHWSVTCRAREEACPCASLDV